MEFLVTNFNHHQQQTDDTPEHAWHSLETELTSVQFSNWFGPMQHELHGEVTIFAPQATLARRNGGALIAGHVFVDGETRLEHQLDNFGILQGAAEKTKGANGVFTIVAPTARGGWSIWTDPTGAYPLHIFRSAGQYAISNNPHMINRLVSRITGPMTRSVEPLFFALTYGTNLDRFSCFDGVRLLGPRTALDLSRDGGISEETYIDAAKLYTSDSSYADGLEDLAQKMTARWNCILDLGHKTCVDLSAGVDSRVSLAGALSTGRLDAFSTYNFGQRPNPDRTIPEHLVTHLGLTPTDASVDNVVTRPSFAENVRMGAFKHCGLRTIDTPDTGPYVLPNLVRVSGGFGELCMGIAPPNAAWAVQKGTGQEYAQKWFENKNPQNFFVNEAALSELMKTTARLMDQVLDYDIPRHQADQVYYAENRAPYHFGIAHRFFNDVRHHIPGLNFLEQVRASSSLKLREIRNRKMHLDLIARLGGYDLALQPFGNFRWKDEFISPQYQEHYAKVAAFTSASEPLCPPVHYPANPWASKNQRPLSQQEQDLQKLANARGLNARFKNAFLYQAEIKESFGRLSAHDRIWDYVDRAEVETLVRKDFDGMLDLLKAQQTQFGRTGILSNVLTWYTGQEEVSTLHLDGSFLNDGADTNASA